MKKRILLKHPFRYFIVFLFAASAMSFADSRDDALFNSALKYHMQKLIKRFSGSSLEKERFLVEQIRMINDEIKARVNNVSRIRENYFDKLQKQLKEIQALKSRLASSGGNSLNIFIDQLEQKIKQTIDSGTINFKRQKVITEAVQLLHVGEEMISMDPNASIESDPDFSQNFRQTRQDFLRSFGYTTASKTAPAAGPKEAGAAKATVFDVYKAWKATELLKYQVRWTDVQVIKKRLLKKGTITENERMFKRELRHALEAYNFGFYELAAASFDEILKKYKTMGRLDDCLYLKGQSNFYLGRFNHAGQDFDEFVSEYPTSNYLTKVYHRLLQIAYHFENYDQVLSVFNKLKSLMSSNAAGMDNMAFLAMVSALKSARYGDVMELAFEIPETSEVYKQSRFVLAESYAGNGDYQKAREIFEKLLAAKNMEPELRFSILLKLGYIAYEQGDYHQAVKHFDLIAGTYPQYDRVLIGYAWSYYKIELNKAPGEQKDFSLARKPLEVLLDNFYSSDYILEAKALLGYISQLEERVDEALDNFGYAFRAREVKDLSDKINSERDGLAEAMKKANRLQDKALEKNDPVAFRKAYSVTRKLRQPLLRLNYMDLSSSGVAVKSEVNRLNKQAAELERLKTIALKRQNKALVKRIENLQLKIFRAVNSLPEQSQSALGLNYFDAHPLARKVSVVENNNRKLRELRQSTLGQRKEITNKISELDVKIQQAKSARNYKEMVRLELSRERFLGLADKLDFLETSTYGMDLKSTNINLKHWADYAAFGMTNVRFAIKNKKDRQIMEIQDQINQINEFLEMRKRNIEFKIAEINDQITLMTRNVRKQERLREREELKKQFNESYFDTRDTELKYEEDTTQPPKLKD